MEPPQDRGAPAGIIGFTDTFVTPLVRSWRIVLSLGGAIAVMGVILLLDVATAARALAVLVAIGLVLEGTDELVQAGRHQVRWPSTVLAGLWIGTGVVAVAWPGVTLWALAVVVGIGFVLGGVAQLAFAVRMHRALPRWAWWAAAGAISVVVGVACLVWPGATVLALAVLLGVKLLLRGVVTIGFALALRRLATTTALH